MKKKAPPQKPKRTISETHRARHRMSKTAVQVMKGAEATRPIVEKVVATETVPVEVDNKLSELQNQRRAALRLLKARKAREDLIAFTQFTMPDPEDPDNADLSRYDPQYFHRALARALQDVESGKIPRLIITFPPRHGKSELSSKRFPAWYIGRDPYRYVAVATYNQTFAEDFGKAVRATMLSPGYRQIFPGTNLRTGSKASDRLETEEGGALYFIGRGGTITGRGADLIIIDDPIKNSEEARSQLVRDQLWEWFQNDIKSRFMTDMGAMIIIQTRWHEDDLVGRLTDPTNPHYDALEAENWKIIDIPAIARDDDVLGRAAGEPLWPERFGLDYLENFKRANPKGFSALYQQRPTPEDGDFFTADMIKTYKAGDLPDRLRIYAASDHAVGVKQENDCTCMLVVGVDDRGCIWLLDCWWRRAKTDVVVEQMITMMDRWKPLRWWAESGHISKSIGPFLMKRMAERRVYCHISEQVPSKDKSTRAQSIQGRMSMGFVRFPMFEGWFEDAKQELLKFPEGRHDDFVDTLAHIGLGLDKIVNGTPQPVVESRGPRVGSLAWVKQSSEYRKRQERVLHNLRGM